MGINIWAAFVGSDQQAVVDGDFVMLPHVLTDSKLGCVTVSLAHRIFLQFKLGRFFYQAEGDAVN